MEQTKVSLFDLYFRWVEETEPPAAFHRWALIASVGAMLGRQVWFPFGSSRIFPNQYVMFVGNPGTRKSTAIKRATKLIGMAGFDSFAAQKTSKEKFLLDLSGAEDSEGGEGVSSAFKNKAAGDAISILRTLNLGGSSDAAEGGPREVFIAADEFNNFLGNGNVEFQSLLGELWDWDEPDRPYKQRLKNSKSIEILQPTVNILAGNTPSNFAAAFPIESIGQGFMSRLILIHAEESGKKITFPPEPNAEDTQQLVRFLMQMRSVCHGPVNMDEEAKSMLNVIYKTWPELEDSRFKHYSTRRFTHLLKLCIIVAAMRLSTVVRGKDVIMANTVLCYAETTMPKAIGELGKSRNSEASNKLMQVLYSAKEPKLLQELWKVVSNDLDKVADLGQLLVSLQQADKIQVVHLDGGKKQGYLAKQKPMSRSAAYTDFELLKGKEYPA